MLMEKGVVGMKYSELKRKEVINICDGRRMGRICDIDLNEHACAVSIEVPQAGGRRRLWGSCDGIVIEWDRIRCIGDDVILVEYSACE